MSIKTRSKVTKAQAEAVFRQFKKKYKGYDLSDADLVFDWYGGHPAICWEGGDAPYEWAIHWHNSQDVEGTFCEPYYTFVLVIYPY